MFHRKQKKDILRMPKIYSAPRVQEKKPVPRFVKYLFFLIIILGGLSYLLFFSPCFVIRNIVTEGTPSKETEVYLDQFRGKNIFSIKAKDIAKVVNEKNTQFKKVDISLGIPNTLRIILTERLPAAVWITSNKSYLVDADAIAFKQVENPSLDLITVVDNKNIVIDPPSQVASPNFIDFIKNVTSKITTLGLKVVKFELNETTFQVDAITDKNIKILFDTTRSVSDQIDAADKAYKEKKDEIKQYMDVRVEGKVYYQ